MYLRFSAPACSHQIFHGKWGWSYFSLEGSKYTWFPAADMTGKYQRQKRAMLGSLRPSKKSRLPARSTIRMRVSEPSQQTNLIWGQGLLMKDSKFSSCWSCPADWGVKNCLDAQRIEVQQWKWPAEELQILLRFQLLASAQYTGSVAHFYWCTNLIRLLPWRKLSLFHLPGFDDSKAYFFLFFCMFRYYRNSISLLIYSAENLL